MAIRTEDFNEIMKYPFQDKQWFSKLVLQGFVIFLLCFVFIGFPFFYGFQVKLAQRAMNKDTSLPGWDEWGDYWSLGWKALVVSVIYALPILIPAFFLAIGAIIFMILLGGSNSFVEEAIGTLLGLGTMVFIVFYIFAMIYAMFLWLLQPVYIAILAAGGSIRDCLAWKIKIWPYLKANFVAIIIALGIAYLAGMVASLGMFVLLIGYFFTYPYAIAVTGYTYGVVYRNSPMKFN